MDRIIFVRKIVSVLTSENVMKIYCGDDGDLLPGQLARK